MENRQAHTEKRVRGQRSNEALPGQLVLTVPQAAHLLGKTPRAVWLAIYRKRLPCRRNGRQVFLLRKELEAFLSELPGTTMAEALDRAED